MYLARCYLYFSSLMMIVMIMKIILIVIVIKLFIIYMCFPCCAAGAVGELYSYTYREYIYINIILGSFMVCRVLGESYSDFATWSAYQVPPSARVCVFLYLFTSLFTFLSLSLSLFFRTSPTVCLL